MAALAMSPSLTPATSHRPRAGFRSGPKRVPCCQNRRCRRSRQTKRSMAADVKTVAERVKAVPIAHLTLADGARVNLAS